MYICVCVCFSLRLFSMCLCACMFVFLCVSVPKCMVINNSDIDKAPMHDITVSYYPIYIYLGSPFTDKGKTSTIDVKERRKHLIKFFAFIQHNLDLPYKLKKQVDYRVFYPRFYTVASHGCVQSILL